MAIDGRPRSKSGLNSDIDPPVHKHKHKHKQEDTKQDKYSRDDKSVKEDKSAREDKHVKEDKYAKEERGGKEEKEERAKHKREQSRHRATQMADVEPTNLNEDPDLMATAARLLTETDATLAVDHCDVGECAMETNEVFPEYEGTKREDASNAKKSQWARARRQRRHVEIALRPLYDHRHVQPPSGSTSAGQFKGKDSLCAEVNKLKKPIGVLKNSGTLCVCENCVFNRETELKCDRLWLACSHEEAITMARGQKRQCLMELPIGFHSIKLRSVRMRVPKTHAYVNPLRKAMEAVAFDTVVNKQNRRQVPVKSDVLTDKQMNLARELDEIDATIRRMRGSADWVAEVVLVVSSLSISRHAFFQSQRLSRFFECKGVEHFLIDVNADIGKDSIDYKVLRLWNKELRLLQDSRKAAAKVELPVLVPQVICDGIPIGTYEDIVDLEDDGDLDYILSRQACPNCLCDRAATAGHCNKCGACYIDLISLQYLSAEEILHLIERSEVFATRIKQPTPEDWERRRRNLGLRKHNEDIATWFEKSQVDIFGKPSIGFCVQFED